MWKKEHTEILEIKKGLMGIYFSLAQLLVVDSSP